MSLIAWFQDLSLINGVRRRGERRAAAAVLALLAFTLAACAAGVSDQIGTANADGIIAGFWLGLWHGLIAPVTFVVSLFSDHVQMYEVHNNGGWYDFGFLIGASSVLGGGHAARGRRR